MSLENSENEMNFLMPPSNDSKNFVKITRHRSEKVTRALQQMMHENEPNSNGCKKRERSNNDGFEGSPPKKFKNDTYDMIKSLKRSSSLTKSSKSKKPSSKLNLKISTPQADKKSKSRSNTLVYSVSFNHLTEKYRSSNKSHVESFPPMISSHDDWKLELGYSLNIHPIRKEGYIDDGSKYYLDSFVQEKQQNFIAQDIDGKPVSISITKIDSNYKILYRFIKGNQLVTVSAEKAKSNNPKKLVKLYSEQALSSVREVKDTKHYEELKLFHSNELYTKFKFGILYRENGQTSENEIFSNQNTSPEFQEFLSLLGEKITLKEFSGYSGGLDTARDSTGTHSIYTSFNGYEIMFHVSTLLPYSEGCEQQLERKRHIGNDVVLIVFQNGKDDVYSPDTVTTHFHHVIAVVQRCDDADGNIRYRVQIARKRDVPDFEPEMPNPPIFASDELKEFLLTKLINGEKASMRASSFREKISRTRAGLLSYFNTAYPKK